MAQQFLTVLAIDDDPGDLHLIRRHVEALGEWKVDFLACLSPQDALEILAKRKVDVVLLDYRLGAGDGLGVLKALTHSGDRLCRAVIMITGQGDEEIAAEAIKAGALDYIAKARLSPEVLYHSILSALEKADLRRQLEIQEQEIVKLARCDALSGLLNRRVLLERLDQEFERSKRYGSPLHVLILDLDDFKAVNDRCGHLVGDDLLAEVGATIRSMTRSTDAAGRIGGDEFCVVIVETKTDGVRVCAERLRESIGALDVTRRAGTCPVSCSIGIAAFVSDMSSPRQLLESADRALYRAKAEGRNRVCV